MKSRIPRRFEPLSDFEIEAYLCGELDAAASGDVEHQAALNAGLRAYIDERQRARAAFAARHPLRIEPLPPRKRARNLALAFPLLAAAVVLVAVVPWQPTADPLQPGAADAVRVKGTPGLAIQLAVKRGDAVWQHREAIPLREGDQLMLALNSGAGYVSLLGRDAAGRITTYYDALRTEGGRFVAPGSLTLDAQAGDELWLVVVSSQPIAAAVYAASWNRGAPIEAAHTFIRIRKDAP